MTERTNNLIVVTGYFGAPIEETARRIAADKAFALVSLDEEIVKRDGRSILRICMLEGEHSYRNKEYEILDILAKAPEQIVGVPEQIIGVPEQADAAAATLSDGVVVWCGDGVLHDDMSREIALAGELVIAGEDMSEEQLWAQARQTENSYHAFMAFGTEEQKRKAFHELYERQKVLFDKCK